MKIAVFTGTRAEYGIMSGLLKKLKGDDFFDLQLIVSGSHLCPEFGSTYRQIEDDGYEINAKVECILSSDTDVGMAKSLGLATISLADTFKQISPDCMILLGDRFELLAAAQTALLLKIPIIHIHGGEITEGAVDDVIRHAISKMAWLHFTSAEAYKSRVIQLGEAPERVFNVGALGVDNILSMSTISFDELNKNLDGQITSPFCLLTYHSTTASPEDDVKTVDDLIGMILDKTNISILATYPNADEGGRRIIDVLENYKKKAPSRVVVEKSLGFKRYVSAVKHATFVVGNSSSGLIEVPSLKTPTINIGDRQKGRIAGESVLQASTCLREIETAVQKCLTEEMQTLAANASNPYGAGDTADKIIKIIKQTKFTKTSKTFHDIVQ